jgi:UDP:flavonoid glycosyltransferase YjiC (YdhE family)
MHKTMVYLGDRQRADLVRFARRRKKTLAAVIREAVDRLLAEEQSPQRSRFVGSAAGPEKGLVSERAEEYLRAYLRRKQPR